MTSIDHQLTALLREFFRQDSFEFTPSTALKDVPGWDSLAHVNLMRSLETEFGVRFTVRDMVKMTTIGSIRSVIESKLAGASQP
jgi:acyl carrier protein